MLSEAKVVLIRKNFEKTYIGKCTITAHQKVKGSNGATGIKEVDVCTDTPCRLSYERISQANNNSMYYSISQTIKLFINPDVVIAPGSKITVTQSGETEVFKASGKPAKYDTHQEVILELEKDKA